MFYKIMSRNFRSNEPGAIHSYGWATHTPRRNRSGDGWESIEAKCPSPRGFLLVKEGHLCAWVKDPSCRIYLASGEEPTVDPAESEAVAAFRMVSLLCPITPECMVKEWDAASMKDVLRLAALLTFGNRGDSAHRRLVRVACAALRAVPREDLDERVQWLSLAERWGRCGASDSELLREASDSGSSFALAQLLYAGEPEAAARAMEGIALSFEGLAAVACASSTTEEADVKLKRVEQTALVTIKEAYPCWTGHTSFWPVLPEDWGAPYR